jgi:hypothetical protein
MKSDVTFALAILMLASAASAAEPAKPGIFPAVPVIEHTEYGDSLNFDIIVANDLQSPLKITQVDVAYLDRNGATLLGRRLDINSAAVRTIPERQIDPGKVRLIYNPFPVLPPGLKPVSVRVSVGLSKPDARYLPIGHLEFTAVPTFTAPIRDGKVQHFVFPLKGRVWVWDGHDLLAHHRRMDYGDPRVRAYSLTANADRYACDLVVVDAKGEMASGDESKNENYVGYTKPVLATGDGVVVAAHDGEPDNRSFDDERSKTDALIAYGNHVVIDHGDGTYSLFGHLHQGSVRFKVGDRVAAGEKIGEVGASGTALFPHLHYQLMNGYAQGAEGVPSYFEGLTRLRGSQRIPVRGTSIDSGDVVEAR